MVGAGDCNGKCSNSGGSVRRRHRVYGYTRGTGGRGTEGSVQHEYKPAEIGEDEDEDQKTCSVGPFMGYASEAIIVRLSSHDPVQFIT